MKTAHQLARELLAGPDLPIFHFDPSCAGFDSELDTSTSDPEIQKVDQEVYSNEFNRTKVAPAFLTIVGNQHEEHGIKAGT